MAQLLYLSHYTFFLCFVLLVIVATHSRILVHIITEQNFFLVRFILYVLSRHLNTFGFYSEAHQRARFPHTHPARVPAPIQTHNQEKRQIPRTKPREMCEPSRAVNKRKSNKTQLETKRQRESWGRREESRSEMGKGITFRSNIVFLKIHFVWHWMKKSTPNSAINFPTLSPRTTSNASALFFHNSLDNLPPLLTLHHRAKASRQKNERKRTSKAEKLE